MSLVLLTLLVLVAMSAVPDPAGDLASTLYLLPVVGATALLAAGVRRVPPARRGPWRAILVAQVMLLAGELLQWGLGLAGSVAWPTPADVLYLLAFLPLAAGYVGFSRPRGAGHRSGLLDATIVTVSAATVWGVVLIVPLASDGTAVLRDRVLACAYPTIDILLVHLLARMLTGPAKRTAAFWLLVAATAAELGADVVMNVVQLTTGDDASPRGANVLWQLFYVLLAAAAWSASAPSLAEKKPRSTLGLTVPRLATLALAAMLPSVLLLVEAARSEMSTVALLAAGSLVLVALVVARIWTLLQQNRSQAVQLAALARTDPLTGIANRRTWDHELSRACATALRDGTSLVVGLLDLDHFKAYNDSRGHQAGDALLKAVTAAWGDALGNRGVLARWGGEEFAVLLPGPCAEEAVAVLDGLRTLVPDDQTCSVGVARWDGTEDPSTLLRRADEALYAAKTGGRNRLVVAVQPAGRAPGTAVSGARPAAGPASADADGPGALPRPRPARAPSPSS
ncbi:hypothetical protein Cma02nite_04520 [Cellulomonas marina]|uniref:Diguanylate cyclase (GGDEF) domain-containing protein n=1 Tax=Cellulomonas marina TaxID=988821 RepID=A0A1I0WS28_9CELL|nr:hypothetical protein Cma02nite_04520 [Cellulomonas marina]SFA91582.1 diguanylate cyclase (GGDEF) domain-containing protein [Cellulomonas marina]